MQIPEKKESRVVKRVKEEPPPPPPEHDYEEIIIIEAEAAENGYHEQRQEEEAQEVVRVVCKDKTRAFVQKEMNKLMTTLDELIEYDDHAFVVNFVLEMSGQAKRKFWEMRGGAVSNT